MSKKKWFHDRTFIMSLLAGLGAALLAAVEEITRKLGRRQTKKKKGGRTQKRKKV